MLFLLLSYDHIPINEAIHEYLKTWYADVGFYNNSTKSGLNIDRKWNDSGFSLDNHKPVKQDVLDFIERAKNYAKNYDGTLPSINKNNTSGVITLIEMMKKYNMPSTLSDIGITADANSLEMYYNNLKESSAIEKNNSNDGLHHSYSSNRYSRHIGMAVYKLKYSNKYI